MILKLYSNGVANSQTIDLSNYANVQQGEGMDVASPSFSDRLLAHSLLKEGATYTYENLQNKELVIPLLLNQATNSALMLLIQQINQVLNTPGATASYQDDNLSQPTYFTLASAQLDVLYSYREAQRSWMPCKLRLFTQPFGTGATTRFYCAASSVGPLLMISPYASNTNQIINATTQAGVLGFGGQQQGPSSGIFYGGNPSLAGDAPAMLQLSIKGALPPNATNAGTVPNTVISWLPDQYYQPLIPASQISGTGALYAHIADGYASSMIYMFAGQAGLWSFNPLHAASAGAAPGAAWAGNHRLFAIARTTQPPLIGATGDVGLTTLPNPLVPFATSATVSGAAWQLYDLGTFQIRPSEYPNTQVYVQVNSLAASTLVTAFAMFPESNSWFFGGGAIAPSQYGYPAALAAFNGGQAVGSAPYTNILMVDDTLPDQFLYSTSGQIAPSPAGAIASASRITQFSRGIVPRPDPSRGVPILAVLSVGQMSTPTTAIPAAYGASTALVTGASWANSQQQQLQVQVNVLERTRYLLP